jgi:hypothetical protein
MSIADTGKKNPQIFFPSLPGTYVFARIKETLVFPNPSPPTQPTDYLDMQQLT